MSACGYCGQDDGGRPYARKRDFPSTTAVSSLLDDGKSRSFGWAASMIAATTAVHHPKDWEGLLGIQSDRAIQNGHVDECTHDKDGLCKACTYLRSEFDRQWSAKANLGNHIHHLALSWARGEEVDEDETTRPFLDALERFYLYHAPTWVEMERTVLYDSPKSHGYRGQFDGIAELDCPACPPVDGIPPRCRWMVDFKTGSYYPVEQTLQLSGYRYAQHLTRWEKGVETIEGPVPTVAHAGVILLGPDGHYRLGELPANATAHGTFLRLRDAWAWSKQMTKWAKEHPIGAGSEMTTEEEAAA